MNEYEWMNEWIWMNEWMKEGMKEGGGRKEQANKRMGFPMKDVGNLMGFPCLLQRVYI